MKKINLLLIITKLELGGAQLSTLELIKGLDKNFYNIYFISGNDGILIQDALDVPNIKIHLLPSLKRETGIITDLRSLFAIYRFIKSKKIDIVHTHSSKAGILGRWAAKFARIKSIIHTVHGWEFHNFQNKIRKSFYIFLERVTAKITNQIIVVTEHDLAKGLLYGIGTREKYKLVSYGIRKDKFSISHNGSFRKKLGIDDSCFLVGMVACFKPQKSPLDFVLIAELVVRHISNVKFIMIGDGQLKSEINALVEKFKLGDKILLLGWQRNIPEIMSSFNVLALTSLWEGLPIVFLEAMASSKPIIANDISGNREIIKDGINGFLVNPKDSLAFAEKIIQLSKNRKLAQQMGERGNAILNNNFDVKQMVKRIHNVYSLELKEKEVN